jgi:penicillin-binding protein 1A
LKILKILFKTFIVLSLLASFGVLGFLTYMYSNINNDMSPLIKYSPKLSTQIFDRNGELISNIYDGEHRIYVDYDDIPSRVVEGLVAIEDTMFFEHNGINIEAIFRAIVKDIKARKFVEGASTLTQQLVKTTLLTREKKLSRKLKEVLLALKLETILTKEEILERYLNEVYFGHGYYGIRTASLGYFRKELSELTLKEIAMLVGLPKAPSFYDPTRNLEASIDRGNKVLYRLHSLGWIEKKQFEEGVIERPMVYNDTISKNRAPYITDAVIKQFSSNIDDLRTGGYKFHVTIDLTIQKLAQEALVKGYEKIKERDKDNKYSKTLNGAMVVTENDTGKILAMVGGVDYKQSSFNRVLQARRQPGSSVKPFIYQAALDIGYSPYTQIADIAKTYEYKVNGEIKKWQPRNYEKNFEGLINLEEGLIHSRNLATINLVNELGIDRVYQRLTNLGIDKVPYDLSISLGSFAISPLDMARLYSSFSNYGTMVTPVLIKRVENRDHQDVEINAYEQYVSPKEQAFLSIHMLRQIPIRGTARLAKVKGLEVAGKTGTTNENKDAWFCGFSPTLQTIVWFGNDDNKRMKRTETGGRAAAPVFSMFYTNLLEIYPELTRKFYEPVGVKYINNKIFTDTSPIPKVKEINTDQKLIF